MQTHRAMPRLSFGEGASPGKRILPEEVAVALSFNGTTQAVMMATPADLEDFAYGFALTEGIAAPDEIASVTVVTLPQGLDVQIWLHDAAQERLSRRRRTMLGPVGCGLCGIDSLEEATRTMAPVPPSAFCLAPVQAMAAVTALGGAQPLHDATRATHAAGFWTAEGLFAAREDVGRHNALDKLAGHLVRHAHPDGAVVLTSRVSIDMVQKTAAVGAPVLIATSAPTAQAVALAETAGITLIALARPDRCEVFTHSNRLVPQEATHVA